MLRLSIVILTALMAMPAAIAKVGLEDMNWSQRGGNANHTGSVDWKAGPYFQSNTPLVLEGMIEGISTWGDQIIANMNIPATMETKPKYNVSSFSKDNRYLWKTDIDSKPIGVPAVYNKNIFIFTSEGKLIRLDPYTGKILMNAKMLQDGSTDVTIAGSYILVGGKNQVVCIDSRKNLRKWHMETENIPQPVAVCGSYVVVNHQSALSCLNLFTGKTVWEVSSSAKTLFSGTPVIGSGLVFISTTDSKLKALSLYSGANAWVKDTVSVTPVTYDKGRIYFPSTKFAYCLNAANGNEIWKSMPGNKPILVWAQSVSTESCLVFPCRDGKVYMLDKKNGKQLSSVQVTSQIAVEIAVGNDYLAVPDNTFKNGKSNRLWFFVTKPQ